jgi:uncharacterized protein involved in exopolysaccharide biosynthesis
MFDFLAGFTGIFLGCVFAAILYILASGGKS